MRVRTPSIQPWQSASSTDSGQARLGSPVARLWKPTTTSVAVAACWSSQSRNSAALAKKIGVRVAMGREYAPVPGAPWQQRRCP